MVLMDPKLNKITSNFSIGMRKVMERVVAIVQSMDKGK